MTSASKKIFSILVVALMVTVIFCAVDTDGATNANEGTLDLGNQSKDVQGYFSEGTATYVYENNVGTLTLTDAKHVTTGDNTMAIHSTVDLVIKVIGKNTIELNTTSTGELYTLMCADTRTSNPHNLTITAADNTRECSLTITSEKSTGNFNRTVLAKDTTISNEVIVTVIAGVGGSNHSIGMDVQKLNVSYSTLVASGMESTNNSFGLDTYSVTIDHSYVYAEGKDAGGKSVGLDFGSGPLIITDSEVYCIGAKGDYDNSSYGLLCNNLGENKLSVTNSALYVVSQNKAVAYSQTLTDKFTNVNKVIGIKTVSGEDVEEEITTTITTDYHSFYTCVSRDVTYDTDGGSAVTGQKVDTFTKFNLPSAPTKDGYTFKGWMDKNGTTYQAGAEYTMPGHSTTFTAIWEKNTPGPEPVPPAEKEKSFWDTPGNIAGVAVISLLILLFLGLIIWDRKNHN